MATSLLVLAQGYLLGVAGAFALTALAASTRLGRDVPRSWITARLHTAQVAAVRFPDPAAPAESTPLDDDEYPTLGVVHIEDVTK